MSSWIKQYLVLLHRIIRVKFFTVAVRRQSLEPCGHVWVIILPHSHHCQGQKEGSLPSGKNGHIKTVVV